MKHQIRGLSINVEQHGSGEPAVVFLHYWGGTSRTWRKVAAELQGKFVTLLDIRRTRLGTVRQGSRWLQTG